MSPTPITGFRLPPRLLERIDEQRGSESRTAWLVRAAEAQLDGGRYPVERAVADGLVSRADGLVAARLPPASKPSWRGEGRAVSSSAAKAGVVPR